MDNAPTQTYDVVIVGTGHAGAQAAITLRKAKFGGSIALIGDEPEYPYERPPLSKEYLAGQKSFERLLIRPGAFWEERNIDLFRSTRVTDVHANNRLLTFSDGQQLQYKKLIWAGGGSPRKIKCPGADLGGIHYVRTKADCDHIMQKMENVDDVIIIGGGYIGLEAAAILAKLGKHVTIVEAADRILGRVAGLELSAFFNAEHRRQGVEIRTSSGVKSVSGQDQAVQFVELNNGEKLACNMLIVGIGIVPAVEPLLSAGATAANMGIAVNRQCQTSLTDIFAIGDCAAHANSYAGDEIVRIESVQNANDQAKVAAKVICGEAASYNAVPWFWSNQYDLKLQTVGLNIGYDETVLRGDPASRSFSVIYLKRGKVIALDCVNAVKDYVQGRKLVENQAQIVPERLTDPRVQLSEMKA